MGGLYYNLALRNSDVGNKDSEKLYYCVLKNRGMVDQETFVNYLSQISGVQVGDGDYQFFARRAECGYSTFGNLQSDGKQHGSKNT